MPATIYINFPMAIQSLNAHQGQRKPEQGVALVVVLIFMLALSTMAAFSARNATLGERQARNEQDYQVARQAAEAALRDAENDLRIADPNGSFKPPGATCPRSFSPLRQRGVASLDLGEFSSSCTAGFCGITAARYAITWDAASATTQGAPWWPSSKGGMWGNNTTITDCGFAGGVPLGTFTGAPTVTGVARQPEYLIELMTTESGDLYECTGKSSANGGGDVLASTDETVDGTGKDSGQAKGPCYVFRISARGFGAAERNNQIDDEPNPMVEVLLQSYFELFTR